MSIEKKLAQLQQKVKTAEQTVLHRQNELLALNKKLESVEVSIQRETKKLLVEQRTELDLDKQNKRKELDDLLESVTVASASVAQYKKLESIAKANLKTLERTIATVQEDIRAGQEDIRVIEQAITTVDEELKSAEAEKERVSGIVRELDTVRERLDATITDLERKKDELTIQVSQLDAQYKAKKETKERELEQLNQDIVDASMKLEDIRLEADRTRSDIAITMKSLSDQDQNLRIREAKVSQQERKTVRNANLLKL